MFSIVVPLYNKEASIVNTLRSVLQQSFQEFEIIVVDDGSTDHSIDKVRLIGDERIKIVSKSNGGVCSARNVGIENSKYKYVAFLDADDQWHKEYLEEQKKLIEEFPDAMMFGVNYSELKNGAPYRTLSTGLPPEYRGYVLDYFRLPNRISDLFCSSSVVINKKVFQVVGNFDERIKYSEDLDMWYRIIAMYPVVFYDKYLVFYLLDTENRALNRQCKLRDFLPFYCDKYYKYKAVNPIFYKYIMNWSAIYIKQYYFNKPSQRKDAAEATLKLDYTVLPKKYKLLFSLPYAIAKILYKIDELRLNVKSALIER